MPESLVYYGTPPALLPLYGRALLPKKKHSGDSIVIPELSASLVGVATATDKLRKYQRVCGFASHHHVPVTWPHILAFPLHLKLLTDDRFPLPLLGLVHLRNTITQHRYFHPHSSPDLVFVRGMEVTTAVGHANVFGVDEWIDFRMTKPSDAHVLERLVHEKGGLLSINHDKPVIPWDYEMPAADCQEVWQSTWLDRNWISLERYQQRLAGGMRLSAIGGSDFHQPADLRPEGPLVLARPTTVLFLPELSEDAILAAMKAGHGYVTESPNGPHLEIRCGNVVMGGETDEITTLDVDVRGAKGDALILVDATGPIARMDISSPDWRTNIALENPVGFVRAEIVAEASRQGLIEDLLALGLGKSAVAADPAVAEQPIRRALSNPIYLRNT